MKFEYREAGLLPEGEYRCKIVGYREVDGRHGPGVRYRFNVLDPPWQDSTLECFFPVRMTKANKTGRLVRAATGRSVGEQDGLRVEMLLEREVRVKVVHQARGKVTFADIAEVFGVDEDELPF